MGWGQCEWGQVVLCSNSRHNSSAWWGRPTERLLLWPSDNWLLMIDLDLDSWKAIGSTCFPFQDRGWHLPRWGRNGHSFITPKHLLHLLYHTSSISHNALRKLWLRVSCFVMPTFLYSNRSSSCFYPPPMGGGLLCLLSPTGLEASDIRINTLMCRSHL